MPHITSASCTLSHPENYVDSGPVLFLLSSLAIGGSERKTVRLANEFHRTGRNVHVAYLSAPATLLSELNKEVPVVCLGRRGKLSFAAIRILRTYMRKERISRIVCVNLYPLIYAHAARRLLSPKKEPSVILMVNTTEHIGGKAKIQMLIYRPLMRRAQKVIFGCRAQLELWRARYGIDEKKCSVIYNGVDEVKFSPDSEGAKPEQAHSGIGRRDKDFLIGTVGQLRPGKNQVELISLLACLKDTLPNARLVIVGDGSERDRLESAARNYGLSQRVSFRGELDDVRPIIEIMDVFILPSISETFSNAALEAMSMGKAVILSDTGGARELVQDGINGYIYAQGSIKSLAALVNLLEADPGFRYALGRSARETVLQNFSFAKMCNKYQRLLQ